MKGVVPGILIVVAVVFSASQTQAASFDGTWAASGAPQSRQCPGVNIHFEVKGNGFSSTIGTAEFTYHFRGSIGPDGSFDTKSPGGTAHIAGKFEGDTVTVAFDNDRCPSPRQASGKRVG